jgi:hypothetical protein
MPGGLLATARSDQHVWVSPHPVSSEKLLTAIQEGLNDQQGAALICAGAKSLDDFYPVGIEQPELQQPYEPVSELLKSQ